jgi:hypothetical protein
MGPMSYLALALVGSKGGDDIYTYLKHKPAKPEWD